MLHYDSRQTGYLLLLISSLHFSLQKLLSTTSFQPFEHKKLYRTCKTKSKSVMDQSSDKKNSEEGGNGYAARTTDAATPPATSTENVAEEAPPATATENVADASEEWSRWQAHTDLLGRTCAKRDRELRVGHFDVQLRYFSKFEAYSPLDAIKNLHSYELLTPRSFSSSEKASETTAEELRQKVKFIVATDQELMDYLTSHSESDDESECYSDETEDEEDEEAEEAEEAAENDVGESGNKNTATTTKISPKNIIKATSISTKNIRATRASEKTANRDNKSRICNENGKSSFCPPLYFLIFFSNQLFNSCDQTLPFTKLFAPILALFDAFRHTCMCRTTATKK